MVVKSNRKTQKTSKKGKKSPTSRKSSSAKTSSKKIEQSGSPKSGVKKQVDIATFLKSFDEKLEKKEFDVAQNMLNSLIGVKKWQRLNLQSLIEYR